MNSRRFHRGTMTVAAPLLLYWVLSGLTIALVDVFDSHQSWATLGGGPGARLNDGAGAALGVPAPDAVAGGITKALASVGDMPIAAVDYRMTGNIARLELSTASGSRNAEQRFYAASGDPMTPLAAAIRGTARSHQVFPQGRCVRIAGPIRRAARRLCDHRDDGERFARVFTRARPLRARGREQIKLSVISRESVS